MELLIHISGRINTDAVLNLKLPKIGDIVVAMPDGHDWTPLELSGPDFRVIKVPGMSQALADSLTAPEPPITLGGPTDKLRYRQFNIALPLLLATFGIKASYTAAQVQTVATLRPRLA